MRITIILSTVFFLNFTAFTQIDSLTCFTPSQIKTFLRTKVELNNCLEQYNVISRDLDTLTASNEILKQDNIKLELKSRRRLKIGLIVGGVAGIISGWLVRSAIK